MSIFNFISNGKSFNVKGPAGLTLEQAKQIFDKQASTGSLVGLKPGSILSAANQAAAGLKSAIASVGQGLSNITGALGGGISSAAGQIGALVKSGGTSVASFASKATSTIKGIVGNSTPSNPIGISDYAKEPSALTGIAKMTVGTVTGVLAQAKNLVNQSPNTMTDNKGVGSFGLTVNQLETAGYLKPGTSKFVAAGSSALSQVLKSPSVFTGKDGVKDVKDLLKNEGTQSKIQQTLMVKGTAALKEIGVPVDKLPANLQAGLSLNAAKSLPDTEKLVKGLPLPTDIKSAMDTTIVSGSFAANFSNTKVPEPFKESEVPVPAADTADRETVNAATSRVIGNQKIPVPEYGAKADNGTTVNDVIEAFNKVDAVIKSIFAKIQDVETQLLALENQASVTESDWALVDAQYQSARAEFNNSNVRAEANAVYNNAPIATKTETKALLINLQKRIENLVEFSTKVKARLAELKQKIQ